MFGTNEVKETYGELRHRMLSSITGSFILSFFVFNWPIAVHLIYGNASAAERVGAIEAYMQAHQWLAFVRPAGFTAVYLLVTPSFRALYLWWAQRSAEWAEKKKIDSDLRVQAYSVVRPPLNKTIPLLRGDLLELIKRLASIGNLAQDIPRAADQVKGIEKVVEATSEAKVISDKLVKRSEEIANLLPGTL